MRLLFRASDCKMEEVKVLRTNDLFPVFTTGYQERFKSQAWV